MPLPQMHGRTHLPAGYAAVVQPAADASLLPQATSDQLRCVLGGAWTGDSAFADCSTGGTSTGTVSNNTLTDIRMDQISIASGSAAFAVNTAVTSEKPLKCILNGWYLFNLNFEWSGAAYADVRTYSLFLTNLADNVADTNMVQSASSPFINAAFNGTFGPLYIRGADLAGSWFKVSVQHNAGSTQTVTGVLLTALYLGPDIDPARMPPF